MAGTALVGLRIFTGRYLAREQLHLFNDLLRRELAVLADGVSLPLATDRFVRIREGLDAGRGDPNFQTWVALYRDGVSFAAGMQALDGITSQLYRYSAFAPEGGTHFLQIRYWQNRSLHPGVCGGVPV